MRGLFIALIFLVAAHEAQAQQQVLPCVPSGNSCIPVSAANPLPVTGGTAAGIVVGTTSITGGSANQLLYDNSGILGELATANSSVLVTSSGGVPSVSTTLPSGLTIPSPTFTTPALGVATGTSLALGGCTIGAFSVCMNGNFEQVGTFAEYVLLQTPTTVGYRWTLNNDSTFRIQQTLNGFSTISTTPFFIDASGDVVLGSASTISGTITYTNGGGLQIGAPTGGDKGASTLNVAGGIYTNGTQGLASKTCTINTTNVTTGITLTITNGLITATTTC